jgi:hypothetical protein
MLLRLMTSVRKVADAKVRLTEAEAELDGALQAATTMMQVGGGSRARAESQVCMLYAPVWRVPAGPWVWHMAACWGLW